jgi:hypothetical protein
MECLQRLQEIKMLLYGDICLKKIAKEMPLLLAGKTILLTF